MWYFNYQGGGGAQLDLDCFDDIRLQSQIRENFRAPGNRTGIGHERDENYPLTTDARYRRW